MTDNECDTFERIRMRSAVPEVSVDWHTAAQLTEDRAWLLAEVVRLRAIISTHDLCHNLHGKVGAREFADGCAAEQRNLYGCAPDADELEKWREYYGSDNPRDGVIGSAVGKIVAQQNREITALKERLSAMGPSLSSPWVSGDGLP